MKIETTICQSIAIALSFFAAFGLTACGDDVENPGEQNENELITTVTLTFTPSGGGSAITASFNDPDGDGGTPPTVDPISLSNSSTYTMTVRFLNELEDPAEDITEEVEEESDVHQVFYTGSAVQGPATGTNASAVVEHSYSDTDENGYPIGLDNTMETTTTGSGEFIVTLRHMPPVNDSPVKTGTLAADVASDGISALPGSTDASVTFNLTVN